MINKIDIKELWKGNEQFTLDKIVLLALKINESIEAINKLTPASQDKE